MVTTFGLKISRPLIKELYASFTALQMSCMYGIILGFSTYLLPQLTSVKNDNQKINQFLAQMAGGSSVSLRTLGCIIDTVSTDLIGRRTMLQISFGCLFICWLMIAFSVPGLMLIIARCVTSIFSGMFVSSGLYVIETTRDETRSNYLCLLPVSLTIGTELVYVLMYFFSWRLTSIIVAVYSGVVCAFISTIPESPYWYVMRRDNNLAEAYKSIEWFGFRSGEQIETILDDMQNRIVREGKPTLSNKLKVLRRPDVAKRIFILSVLLVLLQFTGYMSVNNWSVQLFDGLRTGFDSEILSMVMGIVILACNIGLIFLIDLVERKRLIITAYAGMTVSSVSLSICRYVDDSDVFHDNSIVSYISMFSLFCYVIFLYIGAGSPVWITFTELSPAIIRSATIGFMNIVVMILLAVVVDVVPFFLNDSHRFTSLCIFLIVISISGLLIVIFFLPETES